MTSESSTQADVDGTAEQLDAVVQDLQAALAARRMLDTRTERHHVQMALPDSNMGVPRV